MDSLPTLGEDHSGKGSKLPVALFESMQPKPLLIERGLTTQQVMIVLGETMGFVANILQQP